MPSQINSSPETGIPRAGSFVERELVTQILLEAGVTLNLKSEDPHVLNQEQALIVRDLIKYFETHGDKIESFLIGLKKLCKKEDHVKKFLQITEFRKSNDTSVVIHLDSLFCLLLKIPCLQETIIENLLERVTNAAMEESHDTSWLRTLLKPLRSLPSLKNGHTLTKKLLDIIEISTFASQIEILDALPEILPDRECDLAAKQLTKLLDENDELVGSIVDCLNALNLESEIRAQVQDRILAKILVGTTIKVFPILLQFLLSDFKPQNLISTMIKIRNALDNIMVSAVTNKEKESCKIIIFNHLQNSALSQKHISEAWLNTISNIKVHSDHKPIDFLLIFMLHHISELKKRVIEGIFRKRVSAGLFKEALLEKVFANYVTRQLLKDYMSSMIAIACYLLRYSKDRTVAKFATTMVTCLFNHPYTSAIYRGEILTHLVSMIDSIDPCTTNTILKLISSLVSIDLEKVQANMSVLRNLLEKLDSLELRDVKIVFDILCKLTCGEHADESSAPYKDRIYITVRKQLSSSERIMKHRGIISCVTMVKYMALVSDEQSDMDSLNESFTLETLPEGREPAKLLDFVFACTRGCSELLAFYYDQLCSILAVAEDSFNKYFLYWLQDRVTKEFRSTFITEELPEAEGDLHFSFQYVLNSMQETNVQYGVDIAGLTVCQKSDKILTLAPHFRLLRMLHYRYHNGDLGSIDALVGCGIILPSVEDPRDLDMEQVRLVADSYFHSINWLREIISAFVGQRTNLIQNKVVKRLLNLVEMEKKLYQCLDYISGHNLPLSYFDNVLNVSKQIIKTDAKPAKNSRKKIKSTSVVNDLNETSVSVNTQKSTKPAASMTKRGSPIKHHIKFRELDTDIVYLMRFPLVLANEEPGETQFTQTAALNLDQVKFILCDFSTKLSILTENLNVGLSHLNEVSPEDLIKDCVHILPHINRYLNTVVKQINNLLEKTDGRHDLPDLYSDEAKDIKSCFGYILQIFYLIFNWSGFQHASNVDLLRSLLRSMRPESSQTYNSVSLLIQEFNTRIGNLHDKCLHLSHAVSLIKTMEVLKRLTTVPNNEILKKIPATAEKLLKKRWYNFEGNLDHGKECNQNIDALLKSYLSPVTIQKINVIIETVTEEAESLKSKEDCLVLLNAIDKQNFHVLYLELCNALLNIIKNEVHSLTNEEHIILWEKTTFSLQKLMGITKIQQNRLNLSCFLKKSIAILKIFLTHGVPIMEIMLKNRTDEVIKILRGMQVSTRYLHNLCCQSKLTKDASLVAQVPKFRHVLESLLYRVKAALVANNCSEAFWMGNLRNKDLQGEDILSQSTVLSSTTDEAEDNEQLPSDDENDENIINNVEDDTDTDVSIVY